MLKNVGKWPKIGVFCIFCILYNESTVRLNMFPVPRMSEKLLEGLRDVSHEIKKLINLSDILYTVVGTGRYW